MNVSAGRPDPGMRSQARRVLVAEDSGLIATKIEQLLERAGYQVIGPIATLARALSLAHGAMDAAVLDIDLRGEPAYPLAEMLVERGITVPVPDRISRTSDPCGMAGDPRGWKKPFAEPALLDAISRLVAGTPTEAGRPHSATDHSTGGRILSLIRESRNLRM